MSDDEESTNTEEELQEKFDEHVEEELPEPEDGEDFFNKNTASFRCVAQVLMSCSSILRHPLYHFPPLEDPGIEEAFNFEEPDPIVDNAGCDSYIRKCKEFNIVPIARVIRSLPTRRLDLKYYGLSDKQIEAIMCALKVNIFVKELILEDNRLSPNAMNEISDMLATNLSISYMNLKECRIGPEGARNLNEGISNNDVVQELDLSFNSLGDHGIALLKRGLMDNISIVKINLSHNNLEEEAAMKIGQIFVQNYFIEHLDLSWNELYTNVGTKALCTALTDNKTLKMLNLAWNGIGTKAATTPIKKYLRKCECLEELDISNNRLTGDAFNGIRVGIAKCKSLKRVKIGGNPLTPDEALRLGTSFSNSRTLEYLSMENIYLPKEFVPFERKIKRAGKRIEIGGILSNYVITPPDFLKLLFDRANFLAMKPKKKKKKRNFGHFILELPEGLVNQDQFRALIKKYKMKMIYKDKDLVMQIVKAFPAKKSYCNLGEMKAAYMRYYPDNALPPPKPKKGKGKNDKMEKDIKEENALIDAQMETEQPEPQTQALTENEESLEVEVQPAANEIMTQEQNIIEEYVLGNEEQYENEDEEEDGEEMEYPGEHYENDVI